MNGALAVVAADPRGDRERFAPAERYLARPGGPEADRCGCADDVCAGRQGERDGLAVPPVRCLQVGSLGEQRQPFLVPGRACTA